MHGADTELAFGVTLEQLFETRDVDFESLDVVEERARQADLVLGFLMDPERIAAEGDDQEAQRGDHPEVFMLLLLPDRREGLADQAGMIADRLVWGAGFEIAIDRGSEFCGLRDGFEGEGGSGGAEAHGDGLVDGK